MAYWWEGDPSERYWCEITDRDDVGADLKCPQRDESGNEYWSYSFINLVQPGDIIFHYSTNSRSYVGASVAGGPLEPRPIVWAPHGTVGRARPESRLPRPGWWLPVYGYTRAESPLSLAAMHAPADLEWIKGWLAQMKQHGTIAAPVLVYRPSELRAMQGYLTKMPRAFVERWSGLSGLVSSLGVVQQRVESVVEPLPPLPPLEAVSLEEAATLGEILRPPTTTGTGGNGGGGKAGTRRSKQSKRVGDRAEELIFRRLQGLVATGKIRELHWRARDGETPGWDMDYVTEDGDVVCVEVKGTTGASFSSVDVTAQEWAQAKERGGSYHLHLVSRVLTDKPKFRVLADPWSAHQAGRLTASPATWELRVAGGSLGGATS
jgi:hypothetical protein